MLLTPVTEKEDKRGRGRQLWSRAISSRRSRRGRISDPVVIDSQLYFTPLHIPCSTCKKLRRTYIKCFRIISPWRHFWSNSGVTTRRGRGWWTPWCRRGSARRKPTRTPSTASTGSAPCSRGGDFVHLMIF